MMKRILFAFLPVLLLSAGACTYLGDSFLSDDAGSHYTETPDYVSLRHPANADPRTGLLFYPGALVDYHAYLEWLDSLVLVRPDLRVVAVRMPANLAVLSPEKGLRLLDDFPGVVRWLVAGHSLGGAKACRLIRKNRDRFAGLILLAAYPAGNDDLSGWPGAVLSLSGSEDGIATPEDIEARTGQLPSPYTMTSTDDFPASIGGRASYFEIDGGNHAQFGAYGPQDGDNRATIPREEQHALIVQLIAGFLDRL